MSSPQRQFKSIFDEIPAEVTANEEHMCFLPAREAFRAGKISWEQYLHHALLHWTGSRHAFDNKSWMDPELGSFSDTDPIGYAFWNWQHDATGMRGPEWDHLIAAKWEAVPKIEDLEAVFQAYAATDRPEEVKEKLSVLTAHTSILLSRVLCLLSLQERKLGILELCLRTCKGWEHPVDAWPPSRPFEDLAKSIEKEKEPELYRILKRYGWAAKPWYLQSQSENAGLPIF